LSEESAAQVRSEIQEHYRSAYEAAREGGAPAEEADRRAVAALGGAKAANGQYRRVLLTLQEAKLVEAMNAPPASPSPHIKMGRWMARLLIAEAVAGILLVTWKTHAWLLPNLALVGAALACGFLPIDTLRRGRTYRWAKWTAFIAAAGLAVWMGVKPPWMPLGFLLVPAYFDYVRASVRRKLPIHQWPRKLYR
jgi:hypothetical protein